MNTEIANLALLFTSAFVGATIAFIAALVTFTFHHEIRERLILRGLIVPPNELRPDNPALQRALEHRQRLHEENGNLLHAIEQERRAQGLLVVWILRRENDPNRHLRVGDFPTAFTAWRNQNRDPWAEPPERGPHRLPNDGTIWDPHPQYILDWGQPLAPEQQPVDVLPTYQRCPVIGESTMASTSRRLRRQNTVPFPTPHRAIGLPSTSNNDPAQTSDTDTLVNRDVPEQIRIRPDVPNDIPTPDANDDDPDQPTNRDLLHLEGRGEEDPFNVDGPDFEWPELNTIDREIMGAARASAWEFR